MNNMLETARNRKWPKWTHAQTFCRGEGANSLRSERLQFGDQFYFEMEEVPNFQLFSSQNLDLDNEKLDEIEQKAQAKNTKRATEWE